MKSVKFIKQYLTYSVGYVLKGKESVLDRLVNDLKVAEYITETAYKKAVNTKLKEAQKTQEKECDECKDEFGDCEDCRKKAEARKKRSTRKKTTTNY